MKGKHLVQALVVVVLLTSVLTTVALAQHGNDRIMPQDNNGRESGETYGQQRTYGDDYTDGPGNITTFNRHGVELQRYMTLWSFDRDGEDFYSQPSMTPNATYDWLTQDYYSGKTPEANRTFRYFALINTTDVSFTEPPYGAINKYNENDFRNAPVGKFEPDHTTYVPEGIEQNDPSGILAAFERKTENHVEEGTHTSVGPNEGACRTFPDRDNQYGNEKNGSHERVTVNVVGGSKNPNNYDTHCWIESAYVDEHSVETLVVMQEVYAGTPGPDEKPDILHPINDSTATQQDNEDGVRRFITDTGTARAIVDFRANTTATTPEVNNQYDSYPRNWDEAEFRDRDKKVYKEWWREQNNPDPRIEWTRVVNKSDCPVPEEQYSTPDCQYGINQSDTHVPEISYETKPARVNGKAGDWKVGTERKFIYQSKFSVQMKHYERQCMRIVDPDDDDGDGDPDGEVSLPDDAVIFTNSGQVRVDNLNSDGVTDNGYDGHDHDEGNLDNADDKCDETNEVLNPSSDNAPNNNNNDETESSKTADGDCDYDDSDDDSYEDEAPEHKGSDPCDTNSNITPNTSPDDGDCDYNNDGADGDGNSGDDCDSDASLTSKTSDGDCNANDDYDGDGVQDGNDACESDASLTSKTSDGDCNANDDYDGDGVQNGNDACPNDSDSSEPCDPMNNSGSNNSGSNNSGSNNSGSNNSGPTRTLPMISAGQTLVDELTTLGTTVAKLTMATGAEANSFDGSGQYNYDFRGGWGPYNCGNDVKSASNTGGVSGNTFADEPSYEDTPSAWENMEDVDGHGGPPQDAGGTNEPYGDHVMAVVQTVEDVEMSYIAEDLTYVHPQRLDEGENVGPAYSESGVPEFDAARYENGDYAVHFRTAGFVGGEAWQRVGLHGTQYGLSAGWSFYSGRNLQYDIFTRYAYPSKYSTYNPNITGHHRDAPGLGSTLEAYRNDRSTYGDDLRQNSSLVPLQAHGYPTAAGIKVGPDIQSNLTSEIEVTRDLDLKSDFSEPPTVLGASKEERENLFVSQELPENAKNFSRGSEIAFRYNKSAIRQATGYSYADQFYPSPSYDRHNLTIYGVVPRENRTLNVTHALVEDYGTVDGEAATINETTLDMTVINTNESAGTVTIKFNLTSSSGPINQQAYNGYDDTGGISCGVPSSAPDPTHPSPEYQNLDKPLGIIEVYDKEGIDEYDITDVRTRHDNGTVIHTYNRSKINGSIQAKYVPMNWWDTPDCYPMHESSYDRISVTSGSLFSGWIARLIGLVMVLSILSYAYNTVIVAAGGERPDQTFVGWLIDEVYEAITGWL